MNRWLVTALSLCVWVGPGVAQDPDVFGEEEEEPDYWIDTFYPKLFWAPPDGFTVGGYYAFIQPLRFSQFEEPTAFRAAISFNGQVSTAGSRFLDFKARAPALVDGWRFSLTLRARRRARDGYYGLGNSTTFDRDNITSSDKHFYRAIHTRYLARAEVQRRLVGRLRVLFGIDGHRWKLAPLPGASVLTTDAAGSNGFTYDRFVDEVTGRLGLVYDTRNSEVSPTSGVLAEAIVAGADQGIAGDVSYTRIKLSLQGYIPVSVKLLLAGRVVGQAMGGSPDVGSLYLVEGSERGFFALGGEAHRALFHNRFLGRHKLFTNIEGRYWLLTVQDLIRISAIGFLDVGRVFEGEDLRLTLDGMKVGGGTGLFLQLGPMAIIGVTTGIGPDGPTLDFHTRWPF